MTIKELTQERVSLYLRHNQEPSYPSQNITLFEALAIAQHSKDQTLAARKNLGNEAAYKAEKQKLPCATLSAAFKLNERRCKANVEEVNHTLVLDIDHLKEQGFTASELKQKLIDRYPSAYWAQESCSGDGVFVLIAIADGVDRERCYDWFVQDLLSIGIKLDRLADITRLRFLSWDEHPAYREEVIACINEYTPPKRVLFEAKKVSDSQMLFNLLERPYSAYRKVQASVSPSSTFDKEAYTKKCIEALLDCPSWYEQDSVRSYHALHYVACAFKHFSEGEWWFRKLVSLPGYHSRDEHTIQDMWHKADPSKVSEDDVHRKFQGAYKKFLKLKT